MENDGDLTWACANCPEKRRDNLHPYTLKLLRIMKLQQAGYTVKNNDLTLVEWYDLGIMQEALQPKQQCPLTEKRRK